VADGWRRRWGSAYTAVHSGTLHSPLRCVRVSRICGRVLSRVSGAEALDSSAALALRGCVCLCGVGRCEWVCRALCWCSVRVLCRVCKMVGAVLHSVYLVGVAPRLGGMLALKLGLGRRSPSMPCLMCAGSWARPAEAGVGEVEQQGCLATCSRRHRPS
jgi:hypothetical protein